MVTRSGVRDLMTQGALVAGLAVSVSAVAQAQTASPATNSTAPVQSQAPAFSPSPLVIPQVNVEGAAPPNTLKSSTGLDRLPGTVQDTPQTINVIPQELMREQNVTTLDQALRNVPGITSSIGEGNGGVNGDQFRIRGFNAQNDLFVDGLRDFGSFQRDAFTYEQVDVLKGPSGFALGGAGTVGGGVNVISRTPHLGNSYSGVATGGMGPYARATGDVNVQVDESTAVRLNIMGQSSKLVDRDEQDTQRWGIAPSVAFGLGKDTTLTVEYYHFKDDRATDAGVPIITPTGRTIGRPATEYGLRRANWYGVETDRDEVTVDRITARLSHRVNDWLTLSNDLRSTWVDRDFAYSIPSCGVVNGVSCPDNLLRGRDSQITISGASNPYSQSTWGIQNVTTAVAKFNTGFLRHELTAGIDVWREETDRTGYSYTITRPTVSFLNPDNGLSLTRGAANNQRNTEATNFALFARERLWLLPELSVIGGLRWTRNQIDYTAGTPGQALTTDINADNNFVDPTASIVWEPTQNQTYYFSYSTSSTPPGVNFTTTPASVGQFRNNFEPERNTIYEIGAKFGLFDGRLGLYGSLYRIDKSNSLQTDPNDPNSVVQTGDRQRNQGVEVGLTGKILPEWTINANYTYMDSETRSSTTAANVGQRVQYVPKNAASVWTTYEIARDTPYNVTVGGGIIYRGQVYLNAANTAEAPSNFSLDALVSHKLNQNLTLSVNGYNLTDARNYDALFGSRVVVAPGRTVLVSLAANF